ncbi:MAG TPA: hypothetical protein VIM41_03250 [Gammaproteobacteria bacterium]
MNAFKLDLMTVLAVFVILAVIVTMMLGSNKNDKLSTGAYSQPYRAIGSAGNAAPVSGASYHRRVSQTEMPASKLVSKTWP